MTTLTALEARTTALEYAVFEQFPHTMEAMTHPLTRANALATENVEAIAGLRVDMVALQTSVHREMSEFKAALDLQGDRQRNALAEASAEFRTSLTGVREAMSLRFQKVDGQFNGVRGDIANLQEDVTGLKEDVTGLKEDVTGLKEDVTGLKEDVTGLKEDVTGLKEDVTGLKEDVTGLKSEVATVNARLGGLDVKMDGIDGKIDEIMREMLMNRK